jgi:hypothetical protein
VLIGRVIVNVPEATVIVVKQVKSAAEAGYVEVSGLTAKGVAQFVPPLASGRIPVTPVVSGRPVRFVNTPLTGVPSAGLVSVGEVASTTIPDPVDVVQFCAAPEALIPVGKDPAEQFVGDAASAVAVAAFPEVALLIVAGRESVSPFVAGVRVMFEPATMGKSAK